MKNIFIILSGLLMALHTYGQTNQADAIACDCPTCLAKAAGKTLPYTLPALQELNASHTKTNTYTKPTSQPTHPEEGNHDDHDHDDHDHVEQASPPAHPAEGSHVGHDHSVEENPQAVHAGHDHADVEGIELSAAMIEKVGLHIQEAESGTITKSSVFPAEIKLNRDRMAAVSPPYASLVRQVFVEIGDPVKKGDILVSLENRETLAVYTVAAPLDGIIISKDLAVGETAGPDKVLVEVADLSTVWADISIFPKYQHLIRKGMPVQLIAHDGHSARGKVKYISPIVCSETRTFNARCVLAGAGEDFTPGAFVRARVATESAHAEVVVSREAVQVLDGATVIFVPGDHGFQSQDVELGLADDHSVEIKQGLNSGDRYVAVGAFALKAQMVTSGMDPHAGHGH